MSTANDRSFIPSLLLEPVDLYRVWKRKTHWNIDSEDRLMTRVWEFMDTAESLADAEVLHQFYAEYNAKVYIVEPGTHDCGLTGLKNNCFECQAEISPRVPPF